MVTKLKQILIALLLVGNIGLFSYASASTQEPEGNVTVTVTDKRGQALPFALVTIKGKTSLTGPNGEPANFTLANGKHKIRVTHPLVENRRNKDLVANVKLKLNARRDSADIKVKLKSLMEDDTSEPNLTLLQPSESPVVQSGKQMDFQVAAEDPESDIAVVQAVLNGQDLGAPTINRQQKTYMWNGPELEDGTHTISYTVWNFAGKKREQTFNFVLAQRNPKGNLTGKVTFNGQPVTDATVKIESLTATTDTNGVYTLTGVTTGSKSVVVTAPGLTERTLPVAIEENKTKQLDITLTDTIAPQTPTLTVNNVNPTSSKQTISWTKGTDRSGESYEVQRYKGTQLIETIPTTESTLTFSDLQPDTEYSYKIRAKDGATPANTSNWSAASVKKTQALPTITWTAPTANQKVKGIVQLKVNYEAFGTGNTVKQIEWTLLPNTLLGMSTPTNAKGVSVLDWDSAAVTNGDYRFQVVATDNEGNSRTTELGVTVENPATVGGKITYNNTAVANATVKLDNATTVTTNNEGVYRFVDVAIGTHKVSVSVNGLASQEKTIQVTTPTAHTADFAMTDNVKPSVPGNVTAALQNPTISTIKVSWSASTDYSGIEKYEVKATKGAQAVATQTTTDTSLVLDGLEANTDYTFTVRALDKANPANWSDASAAVTIKTRQVPQAAWVAPTANSNLANTVTLTVSYAVSSSAVKKVEITLPNENQSVASFTPTSTNGQLNHSWDTTTIANGAKVLRVTVTDNEDNVRSADLSVNITNSTAGELKGKITEVGTNAVLSDVNVELKQGNAVIANTKTNTSGDYSFANVEAGTYALALSDEGLVDKVVNNVEVKTGQIANLNVEMSQLPRVSYEGSTIRQLGGTFTAPVGLSVKPGGSELAIAQRFSEEVLLYDAATEQFKKKVFASPLEVRFVAHDNNGLMAAVFGYSRWLNTDNGALTEGPQLGFFDLASRKNGSVFALTSDRIYHFVNRKESAFYNIKAITGDAYAMTASDKSAFVANKNGQKLTRLSSTDPANADKSKSVTLTYQPERVHYIADSRTLIVAEYSGTKLHLIDSRTLEEYAIVDLGVSFGRESGLASYTDGGNSIKTFITTRTNDAVYIITGNR